LRAHLLQSRSKRFNLLFLLGYGRFQFLDLATLWFALFVAFFTCRG
jgi:hypothetical protein